MAFARRLNPYLTFLLLTILISAVASMLAHSVTDPTRRAAIGAAASFDLTVTVTFLYYWLLVRPGFRSKTTMFIIALLGLWRASFLFPDVVPGKVRIGGGLEFALCTALVAGFWKSRNTSRDNDPVERLRLVFSSFIPVPAAARAMVSEFAVLYYGFCSWRARPHVSAGAQVFTLHRKTMAGDLFFCVAVLSLIEILPVHLLVSHWSATAAWILTALSIYGAIWLMAMARAFTLRPMLVSTDGIVVRYGLLFNLRIPAGKIRAVRTQAPTNAIIVPRNTTPSVYLEFTEPLEAEIVLGVRKRVTSIGLSPDDAAAFEAALQIFKSARVLK